MWIKTASIRNFRTIEHLAIAFDQRANVIVGPNAIGKTTLLEAIRLVKAALAPRTQNEPQQVFIGLGALSPHNPLNLNYAALARNPERTVDIDLEIQLSGKEVQELDKLTPNIATNIVRAGLGPQGPLALVQYLSSDQGKAHLAASRKTVDAELAPIKTSARIALRLRIDPVLGTISGLNQLDQMIFAALEGGLPANQALFSYFPADRAMAAGEINIQIGGPDISAQLESHNSQPQTKYARLKPTIVNNYLLSESTRNKLTDNFNKIFTNVLKDRSLIGLSVSPIGLVSIGIREAIANREFDIDGMSSGEKGLILTFLLISHSVAQGGIIMLDEPELHLNPAVCKLILPFLIDEFLVPNDIQAVICSHSPEVLGSAFDSSNCALLHLQSPTVISKIYPEDKREVFDALRRLGTSASDVLFSAGSIFVEGEHDIEILQAGFDELVIKYHVTQLGGRGNIAKEIETLQAAEIRGEVDTLKCFIFDLDRAPTKLTSSKLIKVLQWNRRCLENFLIDEKIIYDILNDQEISQNKIANRGEVPSILREIAVSQLQEVVAGDIYKAMAFEGIGIRPREISGKQYSTMADVLFSRLAILQGQISGLVEDQWKMDFVSRCQKEHQKRQAEWESNWTALCDGKRFFNDLHQRYGVRVSRLKLKKMIVERMAREKTDAWVIVHALLAGGLRIS
jgi:predicted ATPase